jgi:hypothetical protein
MQTGLLRPRVFNRIEFFAHTGREEKASRASFEATIPRRSHIQQDLEKEH